MGGQQSQMYIYIQLSSSTLSSSNTETSVSCEKVYFILPMGFNWGYACCIVLCKCAVFPPVNLDTNTTFNEHLFISSYAIVFPIMLGYKLYTVISLCVFYSLHMYCTHSTHIMLYKICVKPMINVFSVMFVTFLNTLQTSSEHVIQITILLVE